MIIFSFILYVNIKWTSKNNNDLIIYQQYQHFNIKFKKYNICIIIHISRYYNHKYNYVPLLLIFNTNFSSTFLKILQKIVGKLILLNYKIKI